MSRMVKQINRLIVSKHLIMALLATLSCTVAGISQEIKAPGYCILSNSDGLNSKWSEYLYNHLARRTGDIGIVLWQEGKAGFAKVSVELDAVLGHDYCIERTGTDVVLKARDENIALWLIYQYMKSLAGEDSRFEASDLPPAIINWQSGCADFDFVYRDLYLRPALDDEYAAIIGVNSLDKVWGIWGHNLAKILKPDPQKVIYARQQNQLDTSQFCFSNDEIFHRLKEYINEQFGNGTSYPMQFMIMPNDNDIACDCQSCRDAGNTPGNATPAVSTLIKRLAGQFPHHTFFTTAYLTTTLPASGQWPANTGVLLSTANLPKGITLNPEQKDVKKFLGEIAAWKQCISRIYIWDYAANFDDYLTPLPGLYGLKKQLAFFKANGISGIFLQAGGYDYCPFDDMKTFVSAALMIDGCLPVDNLCRQYFAQFYPVSAEALAGYYLSLENNLEQKNKPYQMYGSFKSAMRLYLDEAKFMKLYSSLDSFIKKANGDERLRLEKMRVALSYTRLQVAYFQRTGPSGFAVANEKTLDVKPEIKNAWNRLSEYTKYPGLKQYKETGYLADYLEQWQELFNKAPFGNLLMDEPLESLSALDEDYRQLNVLNDGVLGFEGDYHQGWHLCSTDNMVVRFNTQGLHRAKALTMRFLWDEKHHIYPPVKIEIFKDDKLYRTIECDKEENVTQKIFEVHTKARFSKSESITLKIYRNTSHKRSALACDEIILQ